MINVLFVCLGNICRSPLAEGVFKKMVEEKNVQHLISVDSAGTISNHKGELADPRTRKNATTHGINLIHRARLFSEIDFTEFDYIIPMDESNLKTVLQRQSSISTAKIILMRDFDTVEKGSSVPDPYFGDEADFENVYQILNRSCESFLDYLLKENNFHF